MSVTPSFHQAQYRLARHYLNELQQAESATRRGRENRAHWLNQVQQDWPQIKHWQAWSAAWTDTEIERASLCLAFPLAMSTVLRTRQTQAEFVEWAQRALEAARRLNDNQAERQLLYQLSFVLLNMESLDSAGHYTWQLIGRAQAAGDHLALGRAWSIRGASELLQGNYDNAERLLRESLKQLEPYRSDEALMMVWLNLGRLAAHRGEYQQAYECYEQFLVMVTEADREGWVSIAHTSLSSILIALHHYQAAEEHAQQAVSICRHNGFARGLQVALLSLAHAEKWLGKLESACLHYEAVFPQSALLPPSTRVDYLYGLGQARFRQGDFEQAFTCFDQALKLARDEHILFRLCEVLPDMVVLQLQRHETGASRASLVELVGSARQLNTLPFLVKALSTAVMVWLDEAHYEQAAVWAGLLTQYDQYLDPILFSASVYDQLEAELGHERYHHALEQGKHLALGAAVAQVSSLLD